VSAAGELAPDIEEFGGRVERIDER